MKTKNKLLILFISIVILISAVSCHSTTIIRPDADGTYTTAVYDTSNDAGLFTARYIALMEYADSTYPGDCVIYTSPEGLTMMVDCGNQVSYKELFPILDRMGIKTIDIFVMSHCHADHIGSFAELARNYEVKKVYKNYVEYTSGSYKRAMQAIDELGIDVEILYEGDTFDFGEYVDVEVFWPYEGQTVDLTSAPDTNRSSISMKITYGDSSFWTSGDLYIEDEITLMNRYGERIDCDIMKMSHHGRETSNGRDFIRAVSPKAAVAMQGEFSSVAIMNWFRSAGATVFHTVFDGTIKVSTPGDGTYEIQSQNVRPNAKLYGAPAEDGHYSL